MAYGQRFIVLLTSIAVAIAFVLLLNSISQPRSTLSTSSDTQERLNTPSDTQERLEAPSGTQKRLDTPLGTQKRLDAPTGTRERLDAPTGTPAQCAKACSPCSKSPEYWNLTCHDIIETKPKMRPQLDSRRKVMMSFDTENFFYAWFAPITALLWMEAMKWKPVFIFVLRAESDSDIGPVFKYIIRHLEATGAEVIKIRNTLPEPYYLTGMVVMTLRYAASCMDWPDDPYILISDGDMWPMSAEIFNEQTSVEASVHLIWPKENVPGKSVVPSCYIGMNLSTWREVMHIKKGDDMMQTVAGLRNLVSKGSLSKSQQWSIDQYAFTKRLYDWKGFPDKVHFFGRDRARDRLDRGGGGTFAWRSGLLDSHVLRPGFIPQNWPRLRQLAAHFLDEEQMKWVDAYTERFCHLLFCTHNEIAKNKKPAFHPIGA